MSFYKVPLTPGKTPLKGYGLGIRMQPTVEAPEAVVETLPGLPNINPPQLERLEWVDVNGAPYPDLTYIHDHSRAGAGLTDYYRTLIIGRIVGKFPNDMIWADTAYWGTHPQYGCSVLMEWVKNPLGSGPGDAVGSMNTNGEWSLYGSPLELYTTGPYFLLSLPLYDDFTSDWLGEIRITVTCPGYDPITLVYQINGI